jgi:hypothetical protein
LVAYASAANGAWSTAGSWAPVGVPGAGDTVSISHLILDNVNRTIGTGAGTAITIVAGGILLHTAPGGGAKVTFTIQGNVLLYGTWGTGTPYSSTPGDELEIDCTLANGYCYIYPSGLLNFHGWEGFNEASDLDRTTTNTVITGGVSNTVTLLVDLGLRAGGGDELVLAGDIPTGGEAVTTTAYNPGTKVVTIAGTFANNHAAGTRIMNCTRQVRFKSSLGGTNFYFRSLLTPGTGGQQSLLDHVEFNGCGGNIPGTFYNASAGIWVLLEDCGFINCRGVSYLLGIANEFDYDEETFLLQRCNIGMSVDWDHYSSYVTRVDGEDCWYIGAPVIWECLYWSSFFHRDCVFDSADRFIYVWRVGPHKIRLTDCTLRQVSAVNKMVDTSRVVGTSEPLDLVLDHCLMDSSFDTLVLQQDRLSSEGRVVVLHRNQVANVNEILYTFGTIYLDVNVTYAGQGASLRFDPTNATYALKHIFYVPAQANKAVKAKVWARKDSTHAAFTRPTIKMRGTGFSEQTDMMSDVDDTWELIEVTATPTKNSMLEIELWTKSAAGLAYFDAFAVELV